MSDSVETVADTICLACGCLCDDIVVSVADGTQITNIARACERGEAWFRDVAQAQSLPTATISGNPVESSAALDHAVAVIRQARGPVISGLVTTTIEAQAAAVAIADRIGASIDPHATASANARRIALERVGQVGATWGEIRNRADVIIYWFADPITTHPRHLERFVSPRGRFVPGGRTLFVVDAAATSTAAMAQKFIAIPRDDQLEALSVLRGWIQDGRLDRVRDGATDPLRELATRLCEARYAALFLGPAVSDPLVVEAAYRLIRDLNRRTRAVISTLGTAGNAAGAEAVLGWQTGFGAAVDLSRGVPRMRPDEATLERRLALQEADLVLIVGERPAGLSTAAIQHLSRIPTIVIAPDATHPDREATVGLCSAHPGRDVAGTVLRADGVPLPLRPVLSPSRPDDRDWLRAILDRLARFR